MPFDVWHKRPFHAVWALEMHPGGEKQLVQECFTNTVIMLQLSSTVPTSDAVVVMMIVHDPAFCVNLRTIPSSRTGGGQEREICVGCAARSGSQRPPRLLPRFKHRLDADQLHDIVHIDDAGNLAMLHHR